VTFKGESSSLGSKALGRGSSDAIPCARRRNSDSSQSNISNPSKVIGRSSPSLNKDIVLRGGLDLEWITKHSKTPFNYGKFSNKKGREMGVMARDSDYHFHVGFCALNIPFYNVKRSPLLRMGRLSLTIGRNYNPPLIAGVNKIAISTLHNPLHANSSLN
jgi:hypothetical protein